jgi:hypothetical protein
MSMIPKQAMDANADVQKVVLSGMKIMYAPETAKLLDEGINAEAPLPEKLAMTTAGIMKLVDERSPNGIPPQAVAPGAMLLLFDFAMFLKQTGKENPSEDDIQKAMQMLRPMLVEIFTKHGKGVKGAPPAGMPEQPQQAPQPAPQQPAGLVGATMGA